MQSHPAHPDRELSAGGPSRYPQPQQNTLAIARPRLPSLRHILLQQPPPSHSGNAPNESTLVDSSYHGHPQHLPMQDGDSSLSYGREGGFRLGLQMLAPVHMLPHATTLQQKSWELALDLASNTLLLQRTRRYSFPSSFEHLAHLGQPFPVFRDTEIQHVSVTYDASAREPEHNSVNPAFSLGLVELPQLGLEPGMTDDSLPAIQPSDDVGMEPVSLLDSAHSLPPLASGMSSMRVSSGPPTSVPLRDHLLPSASSDHPFSYNQPIALRAHHIPRDRSRQMSPPVARDASAPTDPYGTAARQGRQSSGISRHETHSAPQVMLGRDRPALESADPVCGPAHRHHAHGSMGQQRGLALAEGYESEDIPYARAPSAHRRPSIASQHTLPTLSGARQLPTFSPERMAGPSRLPIFPAVSGRKRSLEEDDVVDSAGQRPAENGPAPASRQSYFGPASAIQPAVSQRHSQSGNLRGLGAGHHAASVSDGPSWSYRTIPLSSPAHRELPIAGNGGVHPDPLRDPIVNVPQPVQRAHPAYAGSEHHADAPTSHWEHSVPAALPDAHQVEARSESRRIPLEQRNSGARTIADIEEEERDAALRLALLAQAATAADSTGGLGSRPSRVPHESRSAQSPAAQSARHGSQASVVPQSQSGVSYAGAAPQLQLASDASSTPSTSLLGDGTQPENDEQQSTSRTDGGAGHGRYECDVCLKRFTRPSALAVHYHMHTGARPFPCAVCRRSFSVNSNLKRHLRTHTKAERAAVGLD